MSCSRLSVFVSAHIPASVNDAPCLCAAGLGGTCTLHRYPPNIIGNVALKVAGMGTQSSVSLYEYAWVGVPPITVGIYMVFIGRHFAA